MIKLVLLDKKEAQKRIIELDDYLNHINSFNINKITDGNIVDKEKFIEFLPSTCLEWSKDKREKIKKIESTLNFRLTMVNFPIELTVYLIQTNGQDSYNLPYTRSNIIYIPVKENKKEQLGHLNSHLIIHEIFHILSRKFPQIRDVLYPLMGFKKITPRFDVEKYVPSYVVNPDAILYNYATEIKYKNETYKAIPLIFFKDDKFKWDYMALLNEDNSLKTIVHRKKTTFKKRKYNTHYLSHVEEICAENFRKWVMQEENLNNKPLSSTFANKIRDLFF